MQFASSGSEAHGIDALGVLDLGKAAKLLSDMSSVAEEGQLERMQVVAKEEGFLGNARSRVQSQAQVSDSPCCMPSLVECSTP